MDKKITASIFIAISIVCAYLVQAPFTPAIIITMTMFVVAIVYTFKKSFFVAGILFAINALALYGFIQM